MVESEARGRLPGIHPISVIDIGSNSVRLVVYEGLSRSPAVFFNEKVLCGLGRGLAQNGRMDEEGIARALSALRRFRALSEQARATRIHVLATAAAREAENGPAFVEEAEAILGTQIRILTGEEEARYSAYGIISGFHDPDGIAGDLGGGSLELVDVLADRIGHGITLPLGGLRLAEMSNNDVGKAARFAREHIEKADMLEAGHDRTFYCVGGTWRNLARLHMEVTDYPLHMMQAYQLSASEAEDFLGDVIRGKYAKHDAMRVVSKSRRNLLPFGAVSLRETLTRMKPKSVAFSALGVREGYLFSLLDDEEKARDPLLAAAGELAILRARSPEHARELADWTGGVFEAFGMDETEEEGRYRRAACLMADISWRAHPDYRGLQALNIIAHGSFTGITHAGRAYIALANYYRFEGLNDNGSTSPLAAVATPRLLECAKLLGGLLRVVYLFSASMPGVIPRLKVERGEDGAAGSLVFVVPKGLGPFEGERLEGRLQQLAKLTGRTLSFRFEDRA
ncbi:exopolyphosphatase [Pararhizobium haloflavum]|uniref:exopolyphosphatase n=1 Tax=Pararhizobium haloflavum TaxID=2037914 RepID=UPI000C17CEEF|nr:exopolyphosphatase [Pararhizobium haloflavum]